MADDLSLLAVDPLLGWIAAALSAALLAHAALLKFADLALLEQHLVAYGVPGWLQPPLRLALPALELLAAVLLLTPLREVGATAAAALMLVYAGAMAWHRLHGHKLDCGCGGAPMTVSWPLVVRNVVLSAIAGVALLPSTARELGLADFAVLAGALLLATVLHAAVHQVLAHQRPMRPSLWSSK